MNKIYITHSKEETQKNAEKFAKRLKKGDVVALYGNLGGGKTTFVQGLAREFGIKKRIISPTFIIVRQYKVSPARCGTFYHVDLYRIENQRDIEGLGLKEILDDQNNVVAIEWAEKMKSLLPKKRWDVRFEDLGSSKRKITINQKL